MIVGWRQLKLIYFVFWCHKHFNYFPFFAKNENVIKNIPGNKNMKLIFKKSYTYVWSALVGRAATEKRLEPKCSTNAI